MTPEEAAQRQQDVIDVPPNLYVRACPGAGKTRTVVGRFIRVAEESAPRAVAVISFTNRAADEVSRRCAETASRDSRCTRTSSAPSTGSSRRTSSARSDNWAAPSESSTRGRALDVQIGAYGVHGTVSLDHFEISPDGVLRFDRRPRDPTADGAALRQRSRRTRRDATRNSEIRATSPVMTLVSTPYNCSLTIPRFRNCCASGSPRSSWTKHRTAASSNSNF